MLSPLIVLFCSQLYFLTNDNGTNACAKVAEATLTYNGVTQTTKEIQGKVEDTGKSLASPGLALAPYGAYQVIVKKDVNLKLLNSGITLSANKEKGSIGYTFHLF